MFHGFGLLGVVDEKGMKKMNITVLFSRFGKPKNFRKLLTKDDEEEIQEDQKDSKDVKDCNQCL